MSKKLLGLVVALFFMSAPLLADHKRSRNRYRGAPAQFSVAVVTPYGFGVVSGGGRRYDQRYVEYDYPRRGRGHYKKRHFKKRHRDRGHRHYDRCGHRY